MFFSRQIQFTACQKIFNTIQNKNTETIAEEIAKELSEFMKKKIPEHLINEYEFYTFLIAGVRFLHETIEACIKEGLLCEPKSKNGPEGVVIELKK